MAFLKKVSDVLLAHDTVHIIFHSSLKWPLLGFDPKRAVLVFEALNLNYNYF